MKRQTIIVRRGRCKVPDVFSQIYPFSLEVSTQLAVFLQEVLSFLTVLALHLLPQVDIALSLHWDGFHLHLHLCLLLRLLSLSSRFY